MPYAIMRCKKLNSLGNAAAAFSHCYRGRDTPNADPARTKNNEHYGATSAEEALARLRALLPQKRRKDAVLVVEYMMTASPEWWGQATPEQQQEFFRRSREWLADKYGDQNIVTSSIHLDESTPHLSAFVVPLTKDGRLSAKEFIGGKAKLTQDQTTFAETMRPLGLDRGIKRSPARHRTIREWYGLINQPLPEIPEVKTPIPSPLRPRTFWERIPGTPAARRRAREEARVDGQNKRRRAEIWDRYSALQEAFPAAAAEVFELNWKHGVSRKFEAWKSRLGLHRLEQILDSQALQVEATRAEEERLRKDFHERDGKPAPRPDPTPAPTPAPDRRRRVARLLGFDVRPNPAPEPDEDRPRPGLG